MKSLQVLVIDDEPAIRQVLASQLRKAGHEVEHVGTGEAAVERLANGDVDVAVCDIRLPDLNGIEVMRKTQGAGVETTFLMITAYASVSTAIEAMKAGAFDYLIKPLRHEDVLHRLSQVSDFMELRDENRRLRNLVFENGDARCEMPSQSMQQVERLVAKVARTEGTVLITGESGTGKTFIARNIHNQSLRKDAPFVPVNCGAIPEQLLETEFFGHLKGAFTGAERAKKGLMREADGGTLLLDEISELPLALQVKLLHAIEEKEIRPVGGEQTRRVDVRFLAATNRNLSEMVAKGTFREDLFYRLNVLQIHLPPLRERQPDIPPLISFFLHREGQRLSIGRAFTVDPAAMDILVTYPWPGNVRELQNVIARAMILADEDRITLADLPPHVSRQQESEREVAGPSSTRTLREQVREFEISAIRRAIDDASGDRQAAAKRLGVGLSTLYRKLEESERAN